MKTTVESEKNATTTEAPPLKGKRPPAKNAKRAPKAGRGKKAAGKPKADRTDKKAEVIALMKRAKGESHGLAGAHGPRLRQHPGQQGRGEDRIGQECGRRADVQDQVARAQSLQPKRRFRFRPGRRSFLCTLHFLIQ